MACGVFFHLKSGRFSAVGPFQSHNSAAEVKKQEVRHGGRGNRRSRFQNHHSDAVQPDAGMGMSRSQSRQPTSAMRHKVRRAW